MKSFLLFRLLPSRISCFPSLCCCHSQYLYFLPYNRPSFFLCSLEPDFFFLFTPGLIFILTTFNFHQNPRVTVKSFYLETMKTHCLLFWSHLSTLQLIYCFNSHHFADILHLPVPHPSTSSKSSTSGYHWMNNNGENFTSVQFFPLGIYGSYGFLVLPYISSLVVCFLFSAVLLILNYNLKFIPFRIT